MKDQNYAGTCNNNTVWVSSWLRWLEHLCRVERHRFEPRPTRYFSSVSSTLYCTSSLSQSVYYYQFSGHLFYLQSIDHISKLTSSMCAWKCRICIEGVNIDWTFSVMYQLTYLTRLQRAAASGLVRLCFYLFEPIITLVVQLLVFKTHNISYVINNLGLRTLIAHIFIIPCVFRF